MIDTPFLTKSIEPTEFTSSDLVEEVPMLRIGTTKEVASLVGYLLSSESSYITVSHYFPFVVPISSGRGST